MRKALNVILLVCLACSATAYIDDFLRRKTSNAESATLQFNIRSRTATYEWADSTNSFAWRIAFNIDGYMWWSLWLEQPKSAPLGEFNGDYYNMGDYDVFGNEAIHDGCEAFEAGRISISKIYYFHSGADAYMFDDVQFLFKDASGDTCLLAELKANDIKNWPAKEYKDCW